MLFEVTSKFPFFDLHSSKHVATLKSEESNKVFYKATKYGKRFFALYEKKTESY